jgi:hypothetical protein
MTQASAGDLVHPHPAVGGGGDGPRSRNQAAFQQALQCRIERTLLHLQQIVGALLDVLDKRLSMGRLRAQRFQNHDLQSAREQIAGVIVGSRHKAYLLQA